jgi:transposase
LLRALLLLVLYSIRSERMLMEQLDYNLLFRWFVHQSTTDPDARLATKGNGQEAKLFFMGHVVMGNRNCLAVGARLTQAS